MGQAALKLQEYDRLNISQLAEMFDLDRASVRKRINEAEIEALETKAKEKIYELNPRLVGILNDVKSPFSEAKLRRETAEADLKELTLAERRGELVPMGDVIERVQAIITRLYKEFALHQPKRVAKRLIKAKTIAEATKFLKADTDKVFAKLRENDEAFVPLTK